MENLVNIVSTTLPLLLVPGTNNILLMNAGSQFGLQKCLPHIFGSVFGFLTLLLASAFGLSRLISDYPVILLCIKWFGAFWLLKLAWSFLMNHKNKDAKKQGMINPFGFFKATVFMLCNPGAITLALIVFSLSIDSSFFLTYTTTCLVGLFATTIWALNGRLLAPLFNAGQLGLKIRQSLAIIIAYSGVRLILI